MMLILEMSTLVVLQELLVFKSILFIFDPSFCSFWIVSDDLVNYCLELGFLLHRCFCLFALDDFHKVNRVAPKHRTQNDLKNICKQMLYNTYLDQERDPRDEQWKALDGFLDPAVEFVLLHVLEQRQPEQVMNQWHGDHAHCDAEVLPC